MKINVFTASICLTMSQTIFAIEGNLVNVVQATEAENPSKCVIETLKSEEAWEQCLGKLVQLQGTHASPERVMQHPVVQTPQLMEDDNKSRQHQDYLDVEGRQIILLTQDKISCAGTMEVSGLLKKIDLGGEKGTKGEYKNWIVEVSDFHCIDAIEQ